MKLLRKISLLGTCALAFVFAAWSIAFYFSILNDINDETDDSLENYSLYIITKKLSGAELPIGSNGTNNTYFLKEVSQEYAFQVKNIRYSDEMVYISDIEDYEPARVLHTVFKDAEGKYYELTVAIPSVDKADLKQSMLIGLIILFASLFITIIIINLLTYKRTMKPLYTLLQWIDDYTPGGTNKPLSIDTDIIEFQKLNEAATRNAKRHEEMHEEQKQFIDHVAHEMQTPVAICVNRLEMLMDTPDMNQEEKLKEISKLLRTLSYMKKLNKNLLMIARIENGQYIENQKIIFNELFSESIESLAEVYAYKNIGVDVRLEHELSFEMNPILAESLIVNLLKNAFVYNIQGGTIQISTSPHRISISNTGAGTALDKSKLFKRFYKTPSNEGSTGLGLHIAHKICHAYAIDLEYRFLQGKHVFSLIFPQ